MGRPLMKVHTLDKKVHIFKMCHNYYVGVNGKDGKFLGLIAYCIPDKSLKQLERLMAEVRVQESAYIKNHHRRDRYTHQALKNLRRAQAEHSRYEKKIYTEALKYFDAVIKTNNVSFIKKLAEDKK